MDFSLNEEQTAIVDSVKRFCEKHYSLDQRQSMLASGTNCNPEHWQQFADLGWLGVVADETFGGLGCSAIESSLIIEQLGRSLVLEPFWSNAIVSTQLLNHCGDIEHQKSLLEPMIEGNLKVVFAHFEPNSKGDLRHVNSNAVEVESGEFVLNGKKNMLLGGESADRFIVSVKTRDCRDGGLNDESQDGLSLFVLDKSCPGLTLRTSKLIDGQFATELQMEDVRLSEASMIGKQHQAFESIALAVDHGLVGLCAEALGVMDNALWMTRDYLRIRVQYGKPLASFQALQHRMADMYVESELARSSLHHALMGLDETDAEKRHMSVLAALIHVCQSGQFVCRYAVQLHGAMGSVEESIISHYYKRMKVISGLFGSIDKKLTNFTELDLAQSKAEQQAPQPTAQAKDDSLNDEEICANV
jgi:alkylation response protein AidB-like acyl-CoA dehydrogenase